MATGKNSNIEMMPLSTGRKTIWHLQQMKNKGEKISMVGTAYMDPLWSSLAEKAGIDLVRYTAPGETCADRERNISWWTRAIRKMAPNVCLNAVMQTPQYKDGPTAIECGSRILADGADSVMCMGVTNETLACMSANYVPVFGHVGCLSGWQTGQFGGYRRQGKTAEDAYKIWRMAYEYQENGMCGMTIEMTNIEVTNAIAAKLAIPVIEVAAGGAADGSELVIFDLMGFLPPEAMAKHSKAYASVAAEAMKGYMGFDHEVKEGAYPQEEHGWHMDPAELEKFNDMLDKDIH
ncbi:MAG TPA: 3-methyl-2-oxobutanoate hydroxymethyltransferase [Atopobiaceae bacterium]|nr:3-methyl-2-oxobutanoate hydroxymethyltransferase [Atopobiaceae bacterium]